MNDFEKLISEFDSKLSFHFRNNMPLYLPCLIVDKTIYINARVPFPVAISALAEEIGHHITTGNSDITDYNNLVNAKFEVRARRWGYKKLIPYEKLQSFIESKEIIHRYELAEEFNIPDDIVDEVVKMYRIEGTI